MTGEASFGFVSQVIKMFRTKSVGDIGLPTFIQFSLGASFWILYGFHIKDGVVIGANITILLTLIIAIGLYYHYIGRHLQKI